MDCVEAKSKMEPFASGRLSSDDRAMLEEHLQSCEGCRLEVELVRAMGSAPPKSAASSEDEWTIDRIFGTGGAGSRRERGTAASTAPPSAEPPASAEPPPFAEPPPSAEPLPSADPAALTAPDSGAPPDAPATDAPAAAAESALGTEAMAPAPLADADAAVFEKIPTPPPPESPAAAIHETKPPNAGTAKPPVAPRPMAEAPRPDGPDPEASFAGIQLESIQSSSIAEPKRKPDKAGPTPGSKQGSKAPRAATGSSGKESSWEFEPADAKPASSPPEGSLFFAEEALTRQGARKGKSSALRAILWGVGSVVGLGLLVLSLWIALAVRQPSRSPAGAVPSATASRGETSPPVAATTDAEPTDAVAPPTTSTAPPSGGDGASGAGTPSAGTPSAGTPSSASAPPPRARVIEAATVPSGGVATIGAEKALTPAPKPTRSATVSPSRRSSASAAEPAPPVRNPARATGTPGPVITKSERAVPLGGSAAGEGTEEAPKPAPPAGTRAIEPATPDVTTDEAGEPSSAPATTPTRPPAVSTAPSATATQEATAATPAPPAAERPIDRLHLATVTAAQSSDLDALRKLRDTWKGFIKSSVGPDRARAKRELADCLWSIQAITGKNSDKKDALLAYREYVLNAPAGGADARTVARMRQLEDALSDAR
ncbi:MAG TPA: zf-HC2 domain-containing protein [Candidatus Eisenbacteria bacterium]